MKYARSWGCTCIVIAQEKHQAGELHHHIAILNENASKHNAVTKIREAFPERSSPLFIELSCVSLEEGWKTLWGYVTKEDKTPYVWGECLKENRTYDE